MSPIDTLSYVVVLNVAFWCGWFAHGALLQFLDGCALPEVEMDPAAISPPPDMSTAYCDWWDRPTPPHGKH